MKKFCKIFFINVLVLLIVLLFAELITFLYAKSQYESHLNLYPDETKGKYSYNINLHSSDFEIENTNLPEMREPAGLDYKKKSLLLFGCSFTFGSGLEDNQIVSVKLANYTKRPVFNRGIAGSGIQHMYWQLNTDELYKDITVEPEYIIYFFDYFQMQRLYMYTFSLFDDFYNLRYYRNKFDKKGDLIEQRPFLPKYLNGLYLVRLIEEYKFQKFRENPENLSDMINFSFLIFKKCKEKAHQHYPNAKFVVYFFDTGHENIKKESKLQKDLEKEGFIVIRTGDLTDENMFCPKYQISENDSHPNEMFWDKIVPLIAKKLDL